MREKKLKRRDFLKTIAAGTFSLVAGGKICYGLGRPFPELPGKKPNVVYIFADQWRAQATGYSGNTDVLTPNLDALAASSVNFTTAVSGCPVCSPYRASLMTGQFPLTHGVFLNDVDFKPTATTLAQAYKSAGYKTAYIGKWHLDGNQRSAFIPKEKRLGFEFFRGIGCNHYYKDSYYYADEPAKQKWEGYDAIAQTSMAQQYIKDNAGKSPFILVMSWGPPHAPYHSAPEKYRKLFENKELKLRPNIPDHLKKRARKDLAGYYAHIAALDDCLGDLLKTIKDSGIEEDTIFVFTSDHGDMLYSQGHVKKQRPWDESILVPLLIRYPAALGPAGKVIDMPIDAPDIMPTLLGLSGVKIPATVEGKDFSGVIKGTKKPSNTAAIITCPAPFGQYLRDVKGHPKFGPEWGGGKEYRGIRTHRYTYVRDLKGPWLLYDNRKDPYQLNNLVNKRKYIRLQNSMEKLLFMKLKQTNDKFFPADEYIKKWGHPVDGTGTIPFSW